MKSIKAILDTNIVRGIVHGNIDIEDVLEKTQGLSLHLSTVAALELLLQLHEGRIAWNDWSENRLKFSRLIDKRSPIIEHDVYFFSKERNRRKIAIQKFIESNTILLWIVLIKSKSKADLSSVHMSTNQMGEPRNYCFTLPATQEIRNNLKNTAIGFFDRVRENLPKSKISAEEMFNIVKYSIRTNYVNPETILEEAEAYLRVESLMMSMMTQSVPLNLRSKKNSGSALDSHLLFLLNGKQKLVTNDNRLISYLRQAKSKRIDDVITI